MWPQAGRYSYYGAKLRRTLGMKTPLNASGLLYLRSFASDS